MHSIKIRKLDLDIMRITAIIAVVSIHCVSSIIVYRDLTSSAWIATNLFESFIRWCVPVFVMVSGSLLINKKLHKNIKLFYKKRLRRILIPLLSWPLLYYFWAITVLDRDYNIQDLVYGFMLGKPAGGGHLYFLFLIAGLYAITPLISISIAQFNQYQLRIMATVILVASIASYLIEMSAPRGSTNLNAITQGLPYVGYYIIGYLLKDVKLPSFIPTLSIFILSCLLLALLTFRASVTSGGFDSIHYGYLSPLVASSSISFYLLIKSLVAGPIKKLLRRKKVEKVILNLSSAAFGVYLIHILILDTLIMHLSIDKTSFKAALLTIPLVLFLSYVLTQIILRVPKLKLLLG